MGDKYKAQKEAAGGRSSSLAISLTKKSNLFGCYLTFWFWPAII